MSSFKSRIESLTQGVVRCAVAVAMCVSLLQLPVPVMHQHDDFASTDALSGHLVRHHHPTDEVECCCDAPDQDAPHWHLVLPSELGHESQREDRIPSPFAEMSGTVSSTVNAAGSQLQSLQSFANDLLPTQWVHCLASHLRGAADRLANPPCHLHPHALQCVMRC